jgi:hypothetical protein
MSERNIRNCLQKLQQSMAEALRLKVKIDYEVVVRVATTLRYRSPDFTEVCGKYIQRTQDEIRILSIEHDSLGQLDMIIAESIDVCIKCSINEIAGTVNMVDTYLFDSCAEQLDGMSDIGQVFYRCITVYSRATTDWLNTSTMTIGRRRYCTNKNKM